MGQDAGAVRARRASARSSDWEPVEAPARRRRWYDGGGDTLAVLLASESDVDDLLPTLVAFQIEWNKITQRMRAAGWPADDAPTPSRLRATLGGAIDDWLRLRDAWGEAFGARLRRDRRPARVAARADARRHPGRLRAHDAPLVGAGARPPRGQAARGPRRSTSSARTPTACRTSSTGIARQREDELLAYIEGLPESDGLRGELTALRDGRSEGSWENFLYFVAREWIDAGGPQLHEWRARGGGGRGRRAPAEQHGDARPGADHPARRASTPRTSTRAWATSTPTRLAASRGGDRQRRLSARPGRLQHPARGRRSTRARCAPSTCSARRRR